MRIAVVSHKRSDTIMDMTLGFLNRSNIPNDTVDVFVEQSELGDYQHIMKYGFNLYKGDKLLSGQRRAVNLFYPKDSEVFCMDDDVTDIRQLDFQDGKPILADVLDLEKQLLIGFDYCREHNTKLFGLYPVVNAFFMKHEVSSNLKFCIGNAWGQVIDQDPNIQVRLTGSKEDYERTLRYWDKFGSVVRLNYLCAVTKTYKTPGGLQLQRTIKHEVDAVNYLKKRWPNNIADNKRRNSKFPEIKIKAGPVVDPNQTSLF